MMDEETKKLIEEYEEAKRKVYALVPAIREMEEKEKNLSEEDKRKRSIDWEYMGLKWAAEYGNRKHEKIMIASIRKKEYAAEILAILDSEIKNCESEISTLLKCKVLLGQ